MREIKFFIIALTLVIAGSTASQAQQQRGKFNPQEFKEQMEAHITRHAEFSGAEAQAFYPIFHEMKDKQHQLQRKIFELKKNQPTCDAPDKQYNDRIQQINKLKVEMSQLEDTYYKKLCKVVSPKKVYKAMLAEDWFHREMLRKFNQGAPNRQPPHRHKR